MARLSPICESARYLLVTSAIGYTGCRGGVDEVEEDEFTDNDRFNEAYAFLFLFPSKQIAENI